MKEADLARFKSWLEARHYSESTIRTTMVDARQLLRHVREGSEPPARLRATARRLQAFFEPWTPAKLRKVLDALTARQLRGGRRRTSSKPKARRTQPFPANAWARLLDALEDDTSVEARVLLHLQRHPETTITELLGGTVDGGVIHEVLCPDNPGTHPGSCAYRRLDRKLKTLAHEAGVRNTKVTLSRFALTAQKGTRR